MRGKIEKLLNSPIFDDILLGIELSFKLSIEDFKSLYTTTSKYQERNDSRYIAFARIDKTYHFTWRGTIFIYNYEGWEGYERTNLGEDWIILEYQEN